MTAWGCELYFWNQEQVIHGIKTHACSCSAFHSFIVIECAYTFHEWVNSQTAYQADNMHRVQRTHKLGCTQTDSNKLIIFNFSGCYGEITIIGRLVLKSEEERRIRSENQVADLRTSLLVVLRKTKAPYVRNWRTRRIYCRSKRRLLRDCKWSVAQCSADAAIERTGETHVRRAIARCQVSKFRYEFIHRNL